MQVPDNYQLFCEPDGREWYSHKADSYYQPSLDASAVEPFLSTLDFSWTANDLRCLCGVLGVNLLAFKGAANGFNIYAMACYLSLHRAPNDLLTSVRSLTLTEYTKVCQSNPAEFRLPRLTLSSSTYEPLWRTVLYRCLKKSNLRIEPGCLLHNV